MTQSQEKSLEALLGEMSWYGYPRLNRFESGWHCSIDVFVSGAGVEFKVASEFKHPTARAAAEECSGRLEAALASISERKQV